MQHESMTFVIFQRMLLLARMEKKSHQGVRIMLQAQRRLAQSEIPAAIRPEFFAAVRFPDGHSERFIIRNALNLADARELVKLEVGDIRSLLIAQRH